MKKRIATILTTLAATMAFANEPTLSAPLSAGELPTKEKKLVMGETASTDKSFTYLRMGATEAVPLNDVQFIPDVGLGHRFKTKQGGAIDVSGNYTSNLKKEGSTYFFTVPKTSYLHYLSPSKNQSLYAGLGLAFGGVKAKNVEQAFLGLIPSATIGVEMNRNGMPVLAQLDVSQPVFDVANRSFTQMGILSDASGFHPIAELSVGAGF